MSSSCQDCSGCDGQRKLLYEEKQPTTPRFTSLLKVRRVLSKLRGLGARLPLGQSTGLSWGLSIAVLPARLLSCCGSMFLRAKRLRTPWGRICYRPRGAGSAVDPVGQDLPRSPRYQHTDRSTCQSRLFLLQEEIGKRKSQAKVNKCFKKPRISVSCKRRHKALLASRPFPQGTRGQGARGVVKHHHLPPFLRSVGGQRFRLPNRRGAGARDGGMGNHPVGFSVKSGTDKGDVRSNQFQDKPWSSFKWNNTSISEQWT